MTRTDCPKQCRVFSKIEFADRRGLTIVEVLVSLAVISFLLALAGPALLSARMSAQAVTCQARLKQVGVAAHAFHEQEAKFPVGEENLSWLGQLLPHMEQTALLNNLLSAETWQVRHSYVRNAKLPIYQCPSDPHLYEWGVSFVLNEGSTFRQFQEETLLHREDPGEFPLENSVPLSFYSIGPVSMKEIEDGLSNTALASEQLQVQSECRLKRQFVQQDELDEMVRHCERVASQAALASHAYSRDIESGSPGYDHIMTPNSPRCRNTTMTSFHALPGSSHHRGGINVLMADGSVRFVSDSVDQGVWRAVGTRNGGETATLP